MRTDKKFIYTLTTLLACFSIQAFSQPAKNEAIYITKDANVRAEILSRIAPVVNQSIAKGYYPGAVVLVGHRGKLIYKGVFGAQQLKPNYKPMQFDTIFDLASLTKTVATTPSIMQLFEENKLQLDDPVAKYWPKFATNGKDKITIRELLTHTSGLPAELSEDAKLNYNEAILKIEKMKLKNQPGKKFLYSDVNFVALGHLIKLISGKSLDQYATEHFFKPLKMTSTQFLPSNSIRSRIAPTEIVNNHWKQGEVQDPMTSALGGVSGAAGLFSTASDLGLYAQFLLDGGRVKNSNQYLLGPLTIQKMTSTQTPSQIAEARGLGWDMDSRYSNRGILFPVSSFGHTGYTGTAIWIDPTTKTWIVILTSRLHPKASKQNQVITDRRVIANIVAASLTDVRLFSQANTSANELQRAYS